MKFWAVYRYGGSEWHLVRMIDTSQTSVTVSGGTYTVRAMNGANQLSPPAYYFVIDPNAVA